MPIFTNSSNFYSDFLDGYKEGYTPNPDILCNQKIKFGVFYKHVMTSLGVDKMATGHYAQTQTSSNGEVYAQVIHNLWLMMEMDAFLFKLCL